MWLLSGFRKAAALGTGGPEPDSALADAQAERSVTNFPATLPQAHVLAHLEPIGNPVSCKDDLLDRPNVPHASGSAETCAAAGCSLNRPAPLVDTMQASHTGQLENCFRRIVAMRCFPFKVILAVAVLAGLSFPALAAKPAGPMQCYKAETPVDCLLGVAKGRLKRIEDPNDRADAIGELLYALAGTNGQDGSILKEALDLSGNDAVKPVKQMDLLYSIDLYGSAEESLPQQTYISALSRFAKLEKSLRGIELIELYVGACSIMGWDDPFRERWLQFAQSVCTPERLRALQPVGAAERALVLAMMPVAMTFGENSHGFAQSAQLGLSWLSDAEKIAAKSKSREERGFVAFIGVLMHTMNALCLDVFDRPEAAEGEVELALKALRRHEKRVGITGDSTQLRRLVVEAMFRTGREAESRKMLRQMLARVDSDQSGKKIQAAEQIAILALAARIEFDEQAARESQTCIPEGAIEI